MTKPMHPDHSMLIRHLDGELTGEERVSVETHLAQCAECRAGQDAFRDLSDGIEASVRAIPVHLGIGERATLIERLSENTATSIPTNSVKVLRRFGWGMAMAAGLALAVLVNPLMKTGSTERKQNSSAALEAASFNVNGETFVALPYSNPDLPMNSSRIVEMQVPVSALTDAGVMVRPGLNANSDSTVAANVLLGIDGQPLGIDVLGAD